MNLALLVVRVIFGLSMAAHGSQKTFGWFGGGGLRGTRAMIERFGYRPVQLWALAVAGAELVGGMLIAAGLVTPLGGLLVIAAMSHAIVRVHLPKGFFVQKGGIELPLLFFAVALAVLIGGPGRYSVDHLISLSFPEPVTGVVAFVLGLVGSALPLATRPLPHRSAAVKTPG